MSEALKSIEFELRNAMRLTLQGSYHRRAPAKKALPILEAIREKLELWVEEHGQTADALRMLALANEALLNYSTAAEMLQKAINLSPHPNRKDLKRLIAYREARQMFSQIKLSPDELVLLGDYLKRKLFDTVPERSLRWTETWLRENKPKAESLVITSLQKAGYFSDYSVLHNLVPG